MSGEPAGPADVLYVDSDPADALVVQESFAQAGNGLHLHIARDGRQALRFVRGLGEFAGALRPRLILLELNLADVPGLDVLAQLKGDSDLMTIPVVIFSSSQDPRQLRAARQCLHRQARPTSTGSPGSSGSFRRGSSGRYSLRRGRRAGERRTGLRQSWLGCSALSVCMSAAATPAIGSGTAITPRRDAASSDVPGR